MNDSQKPIIEYIEDTKGSWPASIQESFNFLFPQIEEANHGNLLAEELELLVKKVYMEGYRDGLALSNWLKNC